jgi:signal transduction histidine kinase
MELPFIAMAVLAIAAFTVLRGGIVRPLGAVMDAADRVASGSYEVRVPVRGPGPLRALARSFNTMTARLQAHDRERRALMADIAHELRTPLTVLQGTLEGMLDGIYPRDDGRLRQLLDDMHVLSRLIDDLRTLALSESGVLTLERELTDVRALIADVIRTFAGPATEARVTVSLAGGEDPGPIEIDPLRIREVIANLLANAIRYTPADGHVTVTVSGIAGGIEIEVRDTGQGMTADELARAFDRWHKGMDSRGSGLGLAIAKSLVAAHGGEIRAASTLGRGTTVTFRLPGVPRT